MSGTMFGSFARRLTSWYVVAATVLVFVIVSTFAVVALWFYVHIVNEGIDNSARSAAGFALRAAARKEPFHDAAVEFEQRDKNTGVRAVATLFPPPPPNGRLRGQLTIGGMQSREHVEPGAAKPPPPPGETHALYSIVNGRVVHDNPRDVRFAGSRLGFALATAFGAHVSRVPFLEGAIFFSPDPDAVQNAALALFAAVLLVSAGAGWLAWFTGRYITSQALRPLIDVTNALQRFAARDFTPQPIAVAGKSEFDAIALAYNAAAAQVASAFEERTAAEQQMRQFVADAGHELRTPLTIVLGYIDLLRRKAVEGDERSRRIFSSIAVEGARMRTLIDNLVLLARMESAEQRLPEPFPLRSLIDEIVESRRVLAPGTAFELSVDDHPVVIGDRDEIHEAIANVVDNAIKYAPGSPVRIASRAVDGNAVELTISDRGPGIHPDDRAGVFERFYRGATRGDVEGSGLGLAIAKRAVERSGGELRLAETSSSGTVFAFRLRTDSSVSSTPVAVR